ncbi:hypothetical protein [Komagataeibacter xylinus]|uniref:hypothetical protein n=1 Tax=Komagataeibacter xylinus TaxID=28448 RepID=UPI001F0FB485|nr:hypothetical protein [Komagataeibacter xylinus]
MKVRPLPADSPVPPTAQTTAHGTQADHDPALPVIIETLRHDGIITARQVEAARFWATDYRIGVMGLEDPLFDRTSLGLSRRPLNGRSGSISRYRHIHDIIGARYERVLIAAMIDQRPLPELARHARHDPQHMGQVLALLLDFLTRHYDAMPGHLWRG